MLTHWLWRWVPFGLACAALLLSAIVTSWSWQWLANALGYTWMGMLLVLLAQAIYFGIRLSKTAAIVAVARLLVAVGMIVPAGFLSLVRSFTVSEDGFANGLTMPPGLHTDDPLSDHSHFGEAVEDAAGKRWLAALADSSNNGVTIVKAAMPSLHELAGPKRALLLRHLAASAQWRVFRENGRLVATRRLAPSDHWRWTLHGYYSNHEWDRWNNTTPGFQFRVTLGLEGEPWWHGDSNSVLAKQGESVPLSGKPQSGACGPGSHLVIKDAGVALEIMEQAHGPGRILTPLAIADVESELAAVLKGNGASDGLDRSLLPPGSIRRGQADLVVQTGMQGGIYEVYAYVNPGAVGTTYLKAWEVTRGYPLSSDRLFTASNEAIGWSTDPQECFFYNTHVTIYEGDWGQFYAARFELWFKPDDGSPERKLIERTYKIDGWMR